LILILPVSFIATLLHPLDEINLFYFLLLCWIGLQHDLFLHKVIPKLLKGWQCLLRTYTLNKRDPKW
jgi:hypothetical protein